MGDFFQPRSLLTEANLGQREAVFSAIDAFHVRTVHDAWGVVEGLEATISDDRASIEITEGIAYTAIGLSAWIRDMVCGLPPASGWHVLILRECEVSAMPLDEHRAGQEIVPLALAFAEERDGRLLWVSVRQSSRARTTPRGPAFVRAGHGDPELDDDRATVRHKIVFPSTPLYFPTVTVRSGDNEPISTWNDAAVARASVADRIDRQDQYGPFFTVCDAQPSQFTLQFRRPPNEPIRVDWMGILPSRPIRQPNPDAAACQVYEVVIR